MDLMELPGNRVIHDDDAARLHERHVPVHVEEVAEPQAVHQDRVHDRVHVVRAEVGESEHEHVGLSPDLDQLLPVQVLEGALVDGLDLAGVDPGELVRGLDPAVELSARSWGRHLVRLAGRHHQTLVVRGPLPLALVQEAEVLRERLCVHRGLDLEDLQALRGDQPAHPRRGVGDRAVSGARCPCRSASASSCRRCGDA